MIQPETCKLDLDVRRAYSRISETLECAKVVHGATNENNRPALDGLWATLTSNASGKEMQEFIQQSPRVLSKSVAPIIKSRVKEFEASSANSHRSLKVLYNGGLISKTKYKDIRSASALESKPMVKSKKAKGGVQFMEGVPIPRILPYDKVIHFIHSLDIGELHDMSLYCADFSQDDKIEGKFRDVEDLLLRMAKMYLHIDLTYYSKDSPLLNWLGKERGQFMVAIGADGAPFGKEMEATSWLISFLNVGSRIACCNDNFLLCGANCKEDHIAMERYATQLVSSIYDIETKEYRGIVDNVTITFSFELVPSDMKWLAYFSGELNNAAYYFSSFGNVNSCDKGTTTGSLGSSPRDTWQRWDYSRRLIVADKVLALKKELENKALANSTKRKKILDCIRAEKSRQERVPILGRLVDKALAEPLHNTNNAWQLFNKSIMNLSLDVSKIPKGISNVSELPEDCPFSVYLNAVRSQAKCNLLYLKIKRWFQSGITKPFDYRFTGKESKQFCHNFMHLISSVYLAVPHQSASFLVKIHSLAHMGLNLRDAVSLYSRQSITEEYIDELRKSCTHVFNTCSLFLSVNPTVWTIGYAIPVHAQITKSKFNCGLGINTMQGREAKHVKIAKYAEHSLPANRWSLVFRHEYITTLYLREQDPYSIMYKHNTISYIPNCVQYSDFCYCGFPKDSNQDQCTFCLDPLRRAISRSCETGKLDGLICQLLSSSSE